MMLEHVRTTREVDEPVTGERGDHEPTRAREHGETADEPLVADGVGDHGVDACLKRVVVTDRDRCGRVVTVEDRQKPRREQNAERFGERLLLRWHMT
jgi:hypothetical protein